MKLFLKIFTLLALVSAARPLTAMIREDVSKNEKIRPIIEAETECVVCLESAQDIKQSQDKDSIFQTKCCKQFLCKKCFNDLKASQTKSCPHCRNEAKFETEPATIAVEEQGLLGNPDMYNLVNINELLAFISEQYKIEQEIKDRIQNQAYMAKLKAEEDELHKAEQELAQEEEKFAREEALFKREKRIKEFETLLRRTTLSRGSRQPLKLIKQKEDFAKLKPTISAKIINNPDTQNQPEQIEYVEINCPAVSDNGFVERLKSEIKEAINCNDLQRLDEISQSIGSHSVKEALKSFCKTHNHLISINKQINVIKEALISNDLRTFLLEKGNILVPNTDINQIENKGLKNLVSLFNQLACHLICNEIRNNIKDASELANLLKLHQEIQHMIDDLTNN